MFIILLLFFIMYYLINITNTNNYFTQNKTNIKKYLCDMYSFHHLTIMQLREVFLHQCEGWAIY